MTMKRKSPSGESGLTVPDFRHGRLAAGALLLLLLAACSTQPPTPADDSEVETRVRTPAREDSEGIQVYPLQNAAVVELIEDARRAEAAGDLQQAVVMLERALRIQPRDPELLQHMAEVQLQREYYQQALNFAVRSFDTGPRVGEICARNWRTIGVARERLGDRSGARDADQRVANCMVTRPEGL